MTAAIDQTFFDKTWDVVVIGTGIGGGTIGRALAEQGLSVLFVEQGSQGYAHEQTALDAAVFDPVARHIRGMWPTPIRAKVNGRTSEFFAPLGSGLGGSSVFYAATLERPEPHDLDHSYEVPHPTGGWPVSYGQMAPYFGRAERMYHIGGTHDPLSDQRSTLGAPLNMSIGDRAMMENFSAAGLHPYVAHLALKKSKGCHGCFGFKCAHDCKMDGRSAGVLPALETGNAELLTNAKVTKISANRTAVTHLSLQWSGQDKTVHAKRYVLAAGALGSAKLLLASQQKNWPDGCANSSGLVGRNLMFHLTEMIAIWPKRGAGFMGASKSIALRDFYVRGGARLGIVQAMGLEASYGDIVHHLNGIFDRSIFSKLLFLRHLTRIPAMMATWLFGDAKIFVGILEDLPYAQNRLVYDAQNPDHIFVEYDMQPELLARRKSFRKLLKKGFSKNRTWLLGVQPELNFGHPSGTVCFGIDPAKSVLDTNCKTHDLSNLYVVDASFMPTSMGVNPSLTIAANALRVADIIAQELTTQKDN
ncbi:MAG: glucose-methanol-choline oxidoreductase [Rhodobacteraceae bacterium]|nr:MAG: glucose-methanol-choline oxidoreductase [Paracoccaceae bacterium]